MVVSATSFSRTGLSDFLIQRGTAIILGAYATCIVGFLLFQTELTFEIWLHFILSPVMKVFSSVALLSICAHTWIGLWIVGTDYVNEAHFGPISTALRLGYELVYSLALIIYLMVGLAVIWTPS